MDEIFRLSPEAIVYQNLLNFLHYELHFITYLFILFSYVYEAESEVSSAQKRQEALFWSFSYKCNVSMALGAFWKL